MSPKMDEGLNRVCDLFYPNTKTWNWEVLQKSFYPWEAEVIRKIYLSEACNTDCLVWSKTSDGCWLLLGKVHLSDACNRGNQCISIIVKWGRFKGVEEYLEDQSAPKNQAFHVESS